MTKRFLYHQYGQKILLNQYFEVQLMDRTIVHSAVTVGFITDTCSPIICLNSPSMIQSHLFSDALHIYLFNLMPYKENT